MASSAITGTLSKTATAAKIERIQGSPRHCEPPKGGAAIQGLTMDCFADARNDEKGAGTQKGGPLPDRPSLFAGW
jgi:hypothetical protein